MQKYRIKHCFADARNDYAYYRNDFADLAKCGICEKQREKNRREQHHGKAHGAKNIRLKKSFCGT